MTESQEPSYPSEVALLISNQGSGSAYSASTVKGNIKLIDTVYGRQIIPYTIQQVMIRRDIDSSHVFKNLEIGDLGYNSIVWTLVPQYQSKMYSFEVSTQHVSELGDLTPSKIEESYYHTLIRRVATSFEYDPSKKYILST